jgi:hypothetical protein
MVGGGGLLGLWGCLGVGGWAVWSVEFEASQQWQVGVVLLIYIIFFWVCKEGATSSSKEEQGLGCGQLLLN